MYIPKDKSKVNRKERLIEKKCEFPNCEVVYHGTGKSKYCKEHRHRKYRKVIDQSKKVVKDQVKNPNKIIKHEYNEPTTVVMVCECCNKEFQIILYPQTFVYPKYCEDHRNEFRRLYYMKSKGIIDMIPSNDNVDKDSEDLLFEGLPEDVFDN